jgi:hypothetical protein
MLSEFCKRLIFWGLVITGRKREVLYHPFLMIWYERLAKVYRFPDFYKRSLGYMLDMLGDLGNI